MKELSQYKEHKKQGVQYRITLESLEKEKVGYAENKTPISKEFALGILQKANLIKDVPLTDVQVSSLSGGVLNDIFLVTCPEQRYVLKIFDPLRIDPQALATPKELFEVQQQLYAAGCAVPKPYAHIENEDLNITIMEFLENIQIPHETSFALVQALGTSLAQFHLCLKDKTGFKKQPSDATALWGEIVEAGKRATQHCQHGREMTYLFHMSSYAYRVLLTYPSDQNLPKGMLHGDLHSANTLVNQQGKVFIIDNELMSYGPLIKDLAQAIVFYCIPEHVDGERHYGYSFHTALCRALIQSYHALRPLTVEELDYLQVALQDRADLETLGNEKLANMKRPAGTPFNEERRMALMKVLEGSWSNFIAEMKETLAPQESAATFAKTKKLQ